MENNTPYPIVRIVAEINPQADSLLRHMRKHEVEILDCPDDGEEIVLGRASATLIKTASLDPDEVFDLCDGESQALYDMLEALFDDALGQVPGKKKLMEQPEDEFCGDLLLIEEIAVKPEFRGMDLGLLAIMAMMRNIPDSDMTTVVIDPAPITADTCRYMDDILEKGDTPKGEELDAAVARLSAHYARLGFAPIEGERHLHFNMACPLPDIEFKF